MSQITTEQTFDMLPNAVAIYEKIELDKFRKDFQVKNKNKKVDVEDAGVEVILYLTKNLSKVKGDVFELLAIAENKPVEEVKAQPLSKTLQSLKAIFLDKDLMDFFKEAMP